MVLWRSRKSNFWGYLSIGVESNHLISGVEDIVSPKKNFWNTINNRSKVNVNPLNNEDLYEIKYSSGTLLAIRVPKASRYQIPVFIGQNIMLPIKQTKKLWVFYFGFAVYNSFDFFSVEEEGCHATSCLLKFSSTHSGDLYPRPEWR